MNIGDLENSKLFSNSALNSVYFALDFKNLVNANLGVYTNLIGLKLNLFQMKVGFLKEQLIQVL